MSAFNQPEENSQLKDQIPIFSTSSSFNIQSICIQQTKRGKPFISRLKKAPRRFSWPWLDPLRHQLPDSQPRLRQGLRVRAAVAVHVVAVRGAVDVDGRRLGRDVLQHSHRVPRVDRAVDKHDIVNVRVHTSISEEFVRRWCDNI